MRGGASSDEVAAAELSGLKGQEPGAMGPETNKGLIEPPAGLNLPAKPDPLTANRSTTGGNQIMPDAREALLKMLEARTGGRTICPSEVACAIAPKDGWRDKMPTVHLAVDKLVSAGIINLSW